MGDRTTIDVDQAMATVRGLYDLGERAAGSPVEREAAAYLATRMRQAGCTRVELERFGVAARQYHTAALALTSPVERRVDAAWGALSTPTGPTPLQAAIVDARWGTAADFDRLAAAGVDVRGKIVLVDRRDDLTVWADVPARQAAARGATGCLLSWRELEHDALRIDGVPGAPIPVLFIRYDDAQAIRELCRRGDVTGSLLLDATLDEAGQSQNVVGEIRGGELPDEWIVLSGHYDSWFGGAVDNACGTAAVIEAGRALAAAGTRRSVRLIAFGSEESGTGEYFYWCAGSAAYVRDHRAELDRVVLNINADAFAYGPEIALDLGPGLEPAAGEVVGRLGLADRFKVFTLPSIGTDQWFFSKCGVPSASLGPRMGIYNKLYQTDYDTPEIIDLALFEEGIRFAVELALEFDRGDPPYDVRPELQRQRQAIAGAPSLRRHRAIRDLDAALAGTAEPASRGRRAVSALAEHLVVIRFDEHFNALGLVEAYAPMVQGLGRIEHALRATNVSAAIAAAESLPGVRAARNVDGAVWEQLLAEQAASSNSGIAFDARALWAAVSALREGDSRSRMALLRDTAATRRRLTRDLCRRAEAATLALQAEGG